MPFEIGLREFNLLVDINQTTEHPWTEDTEWARNLLALRGSASQGLAAFNLDLMLDKYSTTRGSAKLRAAAMEIEQAIMGERARERWKVGEGAKVLRLG